MLQRQQGQVAAAVVVPGSGPDGAPESRSRSTGRLAGGPPARVLFVLGKRMPDA
jgi:hypothetical protein